MLHSISISDASDSYVVYKNRFVHTERYLVESDFQNKVLPPFMDAFSPFGQLVAQYRVWIRGAAKVPNDNAANTALVWHNNKLLALYETELPTRIEVPSLDTLGVFDFNNALKARDNVTAHPITDPDTGDMIFFGYRIAERPTAFLHYGIFDKHGKAVLHVNFDDMPFSTMHHCFAVTKNYTIFMLFPLYFGKENIMDGLPPVAFHKNRPTKFAVIRRYHNKNDPIQWFEFESCYMFHIFNAFEQDEQIVIQGCATKDFNLDFTSEFKPVIKEFRINLKTKACQVQPLRFKAVDNSNAEAVEIPCEFPVINADYATKKHRYGYAGYISQQGINAVIKVDFEQMTYQMLMNEGAAGEYVYIPKVNAQTEDDGYLCSFVYHQQDNASTFQLVDAKELGKTVTKVKMPRRVPAGFHGIYVTNEQMQHHE